MGGYPSGLSGTRPGHPTPTDYGDVAAALMSTIVSSGGPSGPPTARKRIESVVKREKSKNVNLHVVCNIYFALGDFTEESQLNY